MSKNYTQSTASLKTVTHDTYILDAQKILIYSGEGDRNSRIDLMSSINEQDTKIDNLSLVINDVNDSINEQDIKIDNLSLVLNDVNDSISEIENVIGNLGGDYGEKASDNSWTGSNTFSSSVTLNGTVTSGSSSSITFGNNFSVLPLGYTTVLGAPACGLHVSSTGGVQIWGTHFLQGDEWTDNALKIQHRNLALYGDHTAPTTLTFDNANTIEFKVMPNDGSTANDGQGAIFDFSAWQWDNDSHTSKNANCPVQILKNNAGELVDRSLLNKSEIDANYASKSSYDSFVSSTNSSISTINTTLGTTAKTNAANTFTAANTFDSTATIKGAATFNSTITKSTTTSSPTNTSVLNKGENDKLYPQLTADNTLTGYNTFEQKIEAGGGLESDGSVVVKSGNVYVNKNASITFLDDGEVTINNGASGFPYEAGVPEFLDNGRVYDLGVITEDLDLSGLSFNGDNTIIQTCEIWFTTSLDIKSIIWPSNAYWIDYDDGLMPTLMPNMKYRICIRKEITDIVISISYIYPVR